MRRIIRVIIVTIIVLFVRASCFVAWGDCHFEATSSYQALGDEPPLKDEPPVKSPWKFGYRVGHLGGSQNALGGVPSSSELKAWATERAYDRAGNGSIKQSEISEFVAGCCKGYADGYKEHHGRAF